MQNPLAWDEMKKQMVVGVSGKLEVSTFGEGVFSLMIWRWRACYFVAQSEKQLFSIP